MMDSRAKLVTSFLLFCVVQFGGCVSNDGMSKMIAPGGIGVIHVKTNKLVQLLCQDAHKGNTIAHDACVGCFYKASTKESGDPTMYEMATCADVYFNNTEYGHCSRHLRNATIHIDERVGPTIIHCSFLECIGKVNKASLESLKTMVHVADIAKKNAHLVGIKNYLIGLQGVCLVRNTKPSPNANAIRRFSEPMIPRRNYFNPIVHAGPDNVFQFFINGRPAGPVGPMGPLGEQNRMFARQNRMRRHESNHGRFQESNRFA